MSEQKNNEGSKFISYSPKLNFFFGLILGIAITATTGFIALSLTRNDNSENVAKKQANTNQQVMGEKQQAQQKVDLKINDHDHVLGSKDAPIKIFEFSDFQCPYCARFHTTMHQVIKEYGDKVAWIYKQFPIASHPLGMPGALASECAAEQGKFWQFADKTFENQKSLTADSFEKFAQEIGLDVSQFKACIKEEKYKDKVLTDYNLGIESGVRGTPSNFINNQLVPGAVPYENIKSIIDQLLKK